MLAAGGRVHAARTADEARSDSVRTESAWMRPDAIGAGALSLGYAMTVAASQGLTCHTSLLYGHGANAFAAYPGITRAWHANHLWLPLEVIEDQRTQQLLGGRPLRDRAAAPRGLRVRPLHGAVPARRHGLRQRPAPEPVAVPHQVEAEQVRARESVEASLQEARRVVSARAARMKSTSTTGSTEDSRRRHAENQARLQQHQEPTLGERLAPGDEPDVPDWKVRLYGSRLDTALADDLVYFLKKVEAYERKAVAARAAHQVLNERMEQERPRPAVGARRRSRPRPSRRTAGDRVQGGEPRRGGRGAG
ncbi:hypothetical protein [Streptomyces sp. NPDC051577]|uniref:hypothetical protein n=1 Tax=Streptomyces sp. NPDC051577 TaxID=3155166 RepID=UPI00342DB612